LTVLKRWPASEIRRSSSSGEPRERSTDEFAEPASALTKSSPTWRAKSGSPVSSVSACRSAIASS
jgi:hypothetical protein